MPETRSERRLAENEVIFRQENERLQKGLDELKAIAKEEGQEDLYDLDDEPLLFNCECSDENCRQRVKLTPKRYARIHTRRDHFVIVPGHEVPAIEHMVSSEAGFSIVEKYQQPPETASHLNKTDNPDS